jgi:predicted negative regulator of RcsB-dependent stress response
MFVLRSKAALVAIVVLAALAGLAWIYHEGKSAGAARNASATLEKTNEAIKRRAKANADAAALPDDDAFDRLRPGRR